MTTVFNRESRYFRVNTIFAFISLFMILSFAPLVSICSDNDNELINQYVSSKGNDTIIFTPSNIKQFWIDSSIIAYDDYFVVLLNQDDKPGSNLSQELKLQLANVIGTQNCLIELFADSSNFQFSVFNSKNKLLTSSESKDTFLQYNIHSSQFHLYDTEDLSFTVRFKSNSLKSIKIKSIVLSFLNNDMFSSSPKVILDEKNSTVFASQSLQDEDGYFSFSGRKSSIVLKNSIPIQDKPLFESVWVKNIGKNSATIYLGYEIYTDNEIKLDSGNYPYKGNSVVKVVSSGRGSNKIIVEDDNNSKWSQGCCLVMNASKDGSDLPNTSFVKGNIVEVRKIDNSNNFEIVMDSPLDSELEKGTFLRIHGISGSNLYGKIRDIKPQEETVLTSIIQRNDSIIYINSEYFPKGTKYVRPCIIIVTSGALEDSVVKIKDFTVAY